MSRPDMKAALRSVTRDREDDHFDSTAAKMISVRERSGLLELPIEQVEPNPEQPRKDFSQAALEELADSIRSLGVLQPVLVRAAIGGKYILIAGERRWRAARMAGLMTLPAVVRTLDIEETLEASLTENLQREDLAPIEEAWVMLRMVDELGYSVRRLAERLGKGKGYIEERLRLARMHPDLQALVSVRPDALTHAREIDKIQDADLRAELIQEVRNNTLPLQEVRRRIRAALNAPSVKRNVGIAEIEGNYIEVSGRPDTQDLASRFIKDETTETNSTQVSGRPDTYEALTDTENEIPDHVLAPLKALSDPTIAGVLESARLLRYQILSLLAADTIVDITLRTELNALLTTIHRLLERPKSGPRRSEEVPQ